MKSKNPGIVLQVLSCVIIAIAQFGCGGGFSSTQTAPPISVTVSPSSAGLSAGNAQQFTATLVNDSQNMGVTWTVSCSAPPCGSVSPSTTLSNVATTYTAPPTPLAASMSVTVTATSLAQSSASAQATVTLSALQISVSADNYSVEPGAVAHLTANVPGGTSNINVNWSVSCSPSPCNPGTVSPTTTTATVQGGVATTYTAPSSTPPAGLTVTFTATWAANSSISNSSTLQVDGIQVSVTSPPSTTLLAGAVAPFSATVVNDASNKGVTWSLSCSPAPCGTISPTTTASGKPTTYAAPSTPPPSNLGVTVTATSAAYNGASASAGVTVLAITAAVSPGTALVPLTNASQQFTATIANDPKNQGAAWTLAQGGTACSPACGTISSATTAISGPNTTTTTTTYSPPAKMPANSAVTLTANSVTDKTQSAAATITLSNGTVQLVPYVLAFGNVVVNRTSSAQTTVLTNTGASTLTVKSITITGTDSGDFSLTTTNPCGTSVASGHTCNISVVFKPSVAASRSADITITDSSSDSPQQVSLSGTGRRLRCTEQIKQTLSSAPVRSALTTFGTASVPPPTGANNVGTRLMRLVDSSREDPFLENGTKRELMVRFWYPAALDRACVPAEYTPAAVWSYFSQLMGLPLPAVTTNSCLNAPVVDGAHPVVVFTHGYTGTFTDYTFLLEDLASRGYVVASVDHTYEATAVQFPDGRFVHSGFGSHFGKKLLEDEVSLTFALTVRLDDLRFVVDELGRLNRSAGSPFAGKLDTSRIAVAGHSMGGLAASAAVDREARFKAGLIIDVHDGYVPDAVVGTTRTPVFILASGREQWTENERKLWNNLRGPRFAVNFEGAEHLTASDAVWLAKGAVKTGTMGPDKTVTALREYIAAFLNAALRGYPVDPMLTGPSPVYPDVVVTEPGKPLSSKSRDQSSVIYSSEGP